MSNADFRFLQTTALCDRIAELAHSKLPEKIISIDDMTVRDVVEQIADEQLREKVLAYDARSIRMITSIQRTKVTILYCEI